MPENRQKSIFLFFQTIMDIIFGIFSVVDNYNENHKSFQSPLHGLKPSDFSFPLFLLQLDEERTKSECDGSQRVEY